MKADRPYGRGPSSSHKPFATTTRTTATRATNRPTSSPTRIPSTSSAWPSGRGGRSERCGRKRSVSAHCRQARCGHRHCRCLRGAVAYALDGYPIYGTTEPDGSPVKDLDWMGGHEDADGHYHYHATKAYPYLNGGFPGPGGPEGRPPPGDDRPPPPPREGRPPRADSSPTPRLAASSVENPHLHRERNRARGGENRRAGSDGQNLHDSAGIGHRRHGDVDSPQWVGSCRRVRPT